MTLPTMIVEVAFPAGASTSSLLHLDDPTRGRLDTGSLGDAGSDDAVWVDVTTYMRSGSIQRGSTRVDSPIIQYEAGTCSIVLKNDDRRFDPSNLSGPYVSGGVTQVTAMRAVRIRATWSGTTYELFRGFADQWLVSWSPDSPSYAEVTLTASDGFKVLTGIDRPAVALIGASETTGARINRILDSASWPAADRVIATGDGTVQATTLQGDTLAELRLTSDSEIGEFYIDPGGRATFRNRNALFQDSRSDTSQATFGDGGGSELPYQALGIATDDATFYNQVRVTAPGGTEQMVTDDTSIALFYPKTFKPNSEPIVETDTDALNYARWLLYISKDPELRFVSLGIDPLLDTTNLFPQVLGRLLGDRITVTRRPPGGGTVTKDEFIRGIQHTWTTATWDTNWTLQSADKYGSFLTLDDPILGRLDNNAMAY